MKGQLRDNCAHYLAGSCMVRVSAMHINWHVAVWCACLNEPCGLNADRKDINMGRSGGGGGGGGFSGGFSGGGRSSGGFSGGRSSGGRSRGNTSRGGSFGGGSYRPRTSGSGDSFLGGILGGMIGSSLGGGSRGGYVPPTQRPGSFGSPGSFGPGGPSMSPQNSPSNPGGPNNSNNSGGFGKGTAFGCLAVAIVVILFVVVLGFFGPFGGCTGVSVQPSTVDREPLASGLVNETAYYDDLDGSFIAQPNVLNQGMRQFYEDTGVQPYLYILPNGQMTNPTQMGQFADQLYGELFTDEAHFLVVFCDDNYGSYNVGYTVGAQAKTIMDSEAIQIFNDFLDKNYFNYDLSESQAFADTFEETAERIMSVTPSPLVPIVIAIAIVIIVVIIAIILKRRADQKEREQKRMQDILNTPLESFGDKSVEDLAQKYEDSRKAAEDPNGEKTDKNGVDSRSVPTETFGDKDLKDLEEKYRD